MEVSLWPMAVSCYSFDRFTFLTIYNIFIRCADTSPEHKYFSNGQVYTRYNGSATAFQDIGNQIFHRGLITTKNVNLKHDIHIG